MLSFLKKQHTPQTEVAVTLDSLLLMQYHSAAFRFFLRKLSNSVLSGRHVSHIRGRGLDFEDSRIYVPGDDIRNLDWKISARTGKTHTKVFNEEKDKVMLVMVDQTSGMFFGSVNKTKSVTAAEIGALLAFTTLSNGDRFGGIVFNENDSYLQRPSKVKSSVTRFLQVLTDYNRSLLTIKTYSDESEKYAENILKQVASLSSQNMLIVLISDFRRLKNETFEYMAKLRRHNDVLLFHVYDPLEWQLPEQEVIYSNGKRQIKIKQNQKQLIRKVNSRFAERRNDFFDKITGLKITVVHINTAEPVAEQLSKWGF